MLTIQQAKEELKKGIASYLLKDAERNYILSEVHKLPFYLLGKPGIGKTEIVRQVAEELEIGFVSTSITHHSRNTVLGLPIVTELTNEEGEHIKYTKYTMSEILADVQEKYENGEKEGILLLDEFASMAESLVAPMLAFLQTKNIGNYVLPEGWTIVLCSNPPAYNHTAREFDAAIMDRVRVLEIEFSAKEFIDYGTKKNVHHVILEYLKIHKSHTYICTGGKGDLVTVRGWENLSYCLKAYEMLGQEVTQDLIIQYIKSKEVAHAFYSFYITVGRDLPEGLLSDVLNGVNMQRHLAKLEQSNIATKWGVMNQLIYGIVEASKEHEAQYHQYRLFIAVYEYLKERQEKVQDAWDFYDIIRNRARGRQSFPNTMEQEIFGDSDISEKEQNLYDELLKMIQKQKHQADIDKMKSLKDVSNETTNELVLKVMKEYYSILKTELNDAMTGANEKITNAITFLQHLESKQESYLDAFVEKISQEENVRNVLLICKNKAYGKIIFEINNALGKQFREEAS